MIATVFLLLTPHPICLQWCEQGQIYCYLHLQIKLFESLFNISLVTCRYRQRDMMFIYVSLLLQYLFAPVQKTNTEGNALVFSSGIYCVAYSGVNKGKFTVTFTCR